LTPFKRGTESVPVPIVSVDPESSNEAAAFVVSIAEGAGSAAEFEIDSEVLAFIAPDGAETDEDVGLATGVLVGDVPGASALSTAIPELSSVAVDCA